MTRSQSIIAWGGQDSLRGDAHSGVCENAFPWNLGSSGSPVIRADSARPTGAQCNLAACGVSSLPRKAARLPSPTLGAAPSPLASGGRLLGRGFPGFLWHGVPRGARAVRCPLASCCPGSEPWTNVSGGTGRVAQPEQHLSRHLDFPDRWRPRGPGPWSGHRSLRLYPVADVVEPMSICAHLLCAGHSAQNRGPRRQSLWHMPSRGSPSGEKDRAQSHKGTAVREAEWVTAMTPPRGEAHEGFLEEAAHSWVLDDEELSRWRE